MAVVLFDDTSYDAVRSAIDVTLTAEMLPDTRIIQDIFAGVAQRWVKFYDPLWSTRTTDDDIAALRAAAVFYTASLVLPALPQILQEQFGTTYRYQLDSKDQEKRVAELQGLAIGEINGVTNPLDPAWFMPTMFTRAPGRRGQVYGTG